VSIPSIIVPTLNQDVSQMLMSLDHPSVQVIVIDNGDRRFEDWIEDTFYVVHLPHNIGVAASWNLGIKLTPRADWWLIANDDLQFGEGDLERLEQAVDPHAAAVYMMLGLAAFAITRHTLNAIGWFDEAIHPAYNEDIDFMRRADLAGLPRVEVGFTGSHVGSATIMSDPMLRSINGVTHSANDYYYTQKWGGHKLGGETYSTPFNRGGHLGDWRLDIERLRSQAWPRRKQE
jgi:GT2 family glycosyltransferase